MENYTLYRLCFPDGKNYIGITNIGLKRRLKNGYKHNKYMLEAINKYGKDNIKKEVLATGLSEPLARQLEDSLIKILKSNDLNFGYNIYKGGTTVSEKTYQKIKDIAVKTKAKKVYKLGVGGNLLQTFVSISDAVRSLNKSPTPSNCYKLTRCCKQTKGHKTYQGFIWSFKSPLEN